MHPADSELFDPKRSFLIPSIAEDVTEDELAAHAPAHGVAPTPEVSIVVLPASDADLVIDASLARGRFYFQRPPDAAHAPRLGTSSGRGLAVRARSHRTPRHSCCVGGPSPEDGPGPPGD